MVDELDRGVSPDGAGLSSNDGAASVSTLRASIPDAGRYPIIPNNLAQWAYGPWRISYDPKPIPTRTWDYDWWHDDFDGAPDAGDQRCGSAGSVEDCITAIHEWEDDQ